eukprot:EG_transcript_16208
MAWWRRQAAIPSTMTGEDEVVVAAEMEGVVAVEAEPEAVVEAEAEAELAEAMEGPVGPEVEGEGQGDWEVPAPQTADAADEPDIVDLLEDFITPYEYTPVQLSFGCFGPLSADTQVLRLRNVFGQKIEVKDSSGQLFLKGEGTFKPVGYYFDFYDPIGRFAFSIATVDLQEDEMYEFIGPHGIVIATAIRKRFRPRTEVRVCANTAKLENPIEVECKSQSRTAPIGGRYRVTTPEGLPLGTIRRHHRKGLVTHQNFTVVVGPEVDPYLMVFLAVVCNCVNNERPKLVWTLAAAGLATVLI